MSVAIRIDGFAEAMQRLHDFSRADRKGLMSDIGVEVESQTEERFENAKAPDGSAWRPWSAATKKFVGRYARGSRLLWRSGAGGGRLKNRLTSSASADEVIVGSDVPYARIHQLGGKAGRGKKVMIPARPYLGLSDENVQDIEGILINWVAENL